MTKIWDVVVADDLSKARATAEFLQGFCPPEADTVWSEAYYRWKLSAQNPAGPGFLTLAIHHDKIVGVTSITKKRLRINGKNIIGGEIGDTYTHPDFLRQGKPSTLHDETPDPDAYLNKSIFGRLVTETVDRAHAAGLSIIYGTPNANSMPGYVKRLNFVEYSDYANRNYIRPTIEGVADKFGIVKPFAFALKPVDRLLAKFLSMTSNQGVTLEPYSHQDKEIQTLWKISEIGNDFSILRDDKWFRYRFLDHPIASYSVNVIRQHGSIVGIIVTRTFSTLSGRPFSYIADWLIKDRDPIILRAAIAQLIERNGPQNTDGFTVWLESDSAESRSLKKIGFVASGQSPIIFWNSPEFRSLRMTQPKFSFSIAASDNV